jgi:cobalamin biosynthesis protein CobT
MSESKTKSLKFSKTLKRPWDPESTLVFKAKDDLVVIGRNVKNELVSLDEIALELCVEFGYEYDKTMVDSESEDESDEEGDEGEEGEEGGAKGEEEGEEEEGEEEEGEEEEGEEEEGEEEEGEEKEGTVEKVEVVKEKVEVVKEKVEVVKEKMKVVDKIECVSGDDSAQVLDSISLFSQQVSDAVRGLQSELNRCRSDLRVIEGNLSTRDGELKEMTENYMGMKQKFDVMKGLFA